MAAGKIYRYKPKNRKRVVVRRTKPKIAKVSKLNMSYSMAKRTSLPVIRSLLVNNVYNFVRYVNADIFTIKSDPIAFQGEALEFKMSDVINVTEFTTLFDTYQICKVELEFVPDIDKSVVNITDPAAANQYSIPSIYVHRDLDNAIAPTSENQMSQRQDCIRKNATQRFKYVVVPQVGREIYRSATSTAYETPMSLTWLDCNYADVPHYGVHVGITPTGGTIGTGPTFSYLIKAKYWLRFKTVI